jgi:hypothetical protein
MTPSQRQAGTTAAIEAIKKLYETAPDYGSIGLELHIKAGALIRTTKTIEESEVAK